MSLKLDKVAGQIEEMVKSLALGREEKARRVCEALSLFSEVSGNFETLQAKILRSKTTLLVPELIERPDAKHSPPPLPSDFTVIGTDGSHIDVDRHRQARCFLINIGAVILTYGKNSDAFFDSFPHLYFGDEVFLSPPEGSSGREMAIEGALLGIKRSVHEAQKIAEIVSGLPKDSPALALMDGTLILWGLASKDLPSFVEETLLHRGFLKYLDEIKKQGKERKLSLASYISFPRSTDVVNALKVAICPHETPDCDRYCKNNSIGKRPCDVLSMVQDRDLFGSLLETDERSAPFISGSSVNKQYREHRVHFFYMKLDNEIIRVEIPEWVAQDKELISLTHAITLHQCQKGLGYPVVLSEAHEQAVVTSADRDNFWQLAESCLEAEKLPVSGSAKNFSKKTRWV